MAQKIYMPGINKINSFMDLKGARMCSQLGLSYDRTTLINVLLGLMEKDEIPEVWKKKIIDLIFVFDKYGRKPSHKADFSKLFKYELSSVDYYHERAGEILRRNRSKEKSLKDLIANAKSGKPHLKDKALYRLIAIDPRWLYDDWIQERVVDACNSGNRFFLQSLGDALSKAAKAFIPIPRKDSRADTVIKYLKRKGRLNILPRKLKQLSKEIDTIADLNADISPNNLAKILKRYNLRSRIHRDL